ncbi:TetR/AcrR family transcriptional regulator [Streptomyces litchfieldiae]|uniref:TetR/AcrR family transcriptional regulator n=1 Tax=Streptomyces litchfieldiae TaxID=3075543 RepID=A0ABU2MNF8_9ACTN|nr:TetR/AcrR family transcriptional regulator [Streptomyces sp. DSM 44938]MDT0343146.1 TetR/AcrR family transcriptional regulator [Streptomyces sp. DSM 44938]
MEDTTNATELPPSRRPGSARPGGRTARTREAVRRATLAELAEKGFDRLTVDGVAARSGVHRTTVYRRWGSPAALAADALDLARDEPWPVPDTGTADGDLRAITAEVVSGFTGAATAPVARALVAAAVRDPAAGRALHAFLTGRQRAAAAVVSRAVDRGELPPGTDPEEVVRMAVAPLYYRLFITGEGADAATAERAAAGALAAARAGAFTAAPG